MRALDPPDLGSQASSTVTTADGGEELAFGRFPHQLCWSDNCRGCHYIPLNGFLNCADLNLFRFRGSLSTHNYISNNDFYKLEMPFFFSRRILMNQLFKTKFNRVVFFSPGQVCVFPGPAKKHKVAIGLAE